MKILFGLGFVACLAYELLAIEKGFWGYEPLVMFAFVWCFPVQFVCVIGMKSPD